MTPITMVEGLRKLDPVSERNVAERRFSALASAIREHEASVRRREYALRPMRRCLLPTSPTRSVQRLAF